MTVAREEILKRIRGGLHATPSGAIADGMRAYRVQDESAREEIIELFRERVSDYQARVERVRQAELPGAIASALRSRSVRRLAVPRDLPADWLPGGIEILRDEDLPATALDEVDGVLTGCLLGIAQTGTIVLDGGRYQGRRALTLIPDYHLCVIAEDQVVGLVPEAIGRLNDAARAGRPITLISGPSATSDIELSRVEGVHGPRTLEVLIVDG